MVSLEFTRLLDKNPKVLMLGAHCDDIEIGCGGALIHIVNSVPDLEVNWIVFSSNEEREVEARASAEEYLGACRYRNIEILKFQNGFFPSEVREIKKYFEKLKNQVDPGLIFTHFRHDLHQDHRTINELTWNTFRSHLVLEYEIPKYDGDLGVPNVFFPVTEKALETKIDRLMDCYRSQQSRQWFSESTFKALARIRGIECDSDTGFAEAFHVRKICLT